MNCFNVKTLAVIVSLSCVTEASIAQPTQLSSLTEQNLEALLNSNKVIAEAAESVSGSMELANEAVMELAKETPDFLLAAAQLGDAKSRVESTIASLKQFERQLQQEALRLPVKPQRSKHIANDNIFETSEGVAEIRRLFASEDGSVQYATAHARHFAARVDQYRNVTRYIGRELPDLARAIYQEDAVAYQSVVRQVINALTLDKDLIATYTVLLQRGENPISIPALTLPEVGKLYSTETAVSTVEMLRKRTKIGGDDEKSYRHGDDPFQSLIKVNN